MNEDGAEAVVPTSFTAEVRAREVDFVRELCLRCALVFNSLSYCGVRSEVASYFVDSNYVS